MQVNASNNAGDTPWHWATNMGWSEMAALLERNGASKQKGQVLVPEHVPKVKVRLRMISDHDLR
jgi:ankyrin repeat protein